MFEYNAKVKDEEGNIYRVVAPVDGEAALTVVWSDVACNTVIVFPTSQLIETSETLIEGEYAHLVYDVTPTDDGESLKVTRKIDSRGMNCVVGAYDDLRSFVGLNLEDMTIEELDKLLKNAKET